MPITWEGCDMRLRKPPGFLSRKEARFSSGPRCCITEGRREIIIGDLEERECSPGHPNRHHSEAGDLPPSISQVLISTSHVVSIVDSAIDGQSIDWLVFDYAKRSSVNL